MKLLLVLLLLTPLAGCGRGPTPSTEFGRYQIVPVPAGVTVPGTNQGGVPEVWRLDTMTGAIAICYQDEGVKCSRPTPP